MPTVAALTQVQSTLPGGVSGWSRRPTPYGRGEASGLREAAQGFEALFLEGLVKGFRRTTLGRGGREKTLYQGLLDEELARVCASRGVGLAEVLETRLGKACGSNPPGAKGSLKVSDNDPITSSGVEGGPRRAIRGGAEQGLERTGTCVQARGGLSARAGDGTGLSAAGTPALLRYGTRLEVLRGIAHRGVQR